MEATHTHQPTGSACGATAAQIAQRAAASGMSATTIDEGFCSICGNELDDAMLQAVRENES
jgi:hypothetical protein